MCPSEGVYSFTYEHTATQTPGPQRAALRFRRVTAGCIHHSWPFLSLSVQAREERERDRMGWGGVGDEVDLQVRMHTEVPLYGLLGWHQPSLQGEPSWSPSKHQC